jgi:hypothetical protein
VKRDELRELHYITPISNVPSIVANGILSHRRAPSGSRSVASAEVQARRASKVVPGARPLHHYANLYVNGRNPMLFMRTMHMHRDLTVLRIDPVVLDLPGAVVTVVNAARDLARFYAPAEGVSRLDQTVVFATYWTHPGDPMAEYEHKGAMCAEVLVPDRVSPEMVAGAYVACQDAKRTIDGLGTNLASEVNRRLFFEVCQA